MAVLMSSCSAGSSKTWNHDASASDSACAFSTKRNCSGAFISGRE